VRPQSGFKAILMPKNTGAGVVLAGLSTVFGFAMIWHVWWLAIASFVALLSAAIAHTFNYNREFHIPADQVAGVESTRTQMLTASH